jgi:PAS domain S-box-containing protein
MLSDLFTAIDLSKILLHNPPIVVSSLKVAEAISLMNVNRTTCSLTDKLNLKQPQLLTEAESNCVLVVENNQLVGILTERDVVQLSAKSCSLAEITLAEVMINPVLTLQESEFTDLFVALNLFEKYQIHHLPIVDGQGQIVGLLTHNSLQQLVSSIDWLRLRQVTEVMTTQVVYAQPTTSVARLTKLLADHQVSSVVIVEESEQTENYNLSPIGIVTEQELVQLLALELNFAQIQAQQVMSSTVFSVLSDASLYSVWMLMQQKQTNQVVIKNTQDYLLGIVTLTDLFKAFNPLEIYRMVDKLEKQVSQLEAEKLELIESKTRELEKQVQKRTTELQVQTELEEQRRTEQALRESEAQLKLAFEAARMGSWNWNIQKGEIKWSTNMEALFGLAPGEFDGSYKMFVDSLHPEDRDRLLKESQTNLTKPRKFQTEGRHLLPDGTIKWFLTQTLPEIDPDGKQIGFFGTLTDITERKQAEAKLQEINQQLE